MLLSDLDRAQRDRQRFLRYVGARPEEDWLACWGWQGPTTGKPVHRYGVMGLKVNGKSTTMYAHRLAVLFTDGELADDADVCHRCDNGLCVRRSHLYVGNASTGIQDAWDREHRRREQPNLWGSKHPRAKLTEDQVLAIRYRRAQGETVVALAQEFGVHPSLITRIAKGQTWRHIPLLPGPRE